jgi:hypothetical protein
MASLGLNSLWSDISKAEGDVSGVVTDIMGPSYSYAQNIPSLSSQGVGTDGSFGQVWTNTQAAMNYLKYMISGPALGNQFYVNSGGVCTAPDGSTQPRHNWVSNLSDGSKIADFLPSTIGQDVGFLTSDLNGLIPGIINDIESGLDVSTMYSALTLPSQPPCQCYQCPVTGGGPNAFFVTPALSPDFDPNVCQEVDPSVCTGAAEGFHNQNTMSCVPTLIALGGLILLKLL